MFVVFLFPLVFSVIAAFMFATGESGLFTKIFFVSLTIASVVLQFVPYCQEHVHFLVPLFMQLFVGGCYYFASQLP